MATHHHIYENPPGLNSVILSSGNNGVRPFSSLTSGEREVELTGEGAAELAAASGVGQWAVAGMAFFFFFFVIYFFFKTKRVKEKVGFSVLLAFAFFVFFCLMLMCQSLIGGQKPLGFCQCRIEVILLKSLLYSLHTRY
jgi:hypothetical protein